MTGHRHDRRRARRRRTVRTGGGADWDAVGCRLLWVDVEAATMTSSTPTACHRVTELASASTIVVPDDSGGLVGRAPTSWWRWRRTDAISQSWPLAAGDGCTNDGRRDPQGRLWVGTVDRPKPTPPGCSGRPRRSRRPGPRLGRHVERHRLEPGRATLRLRRLVHAPGRRDGAGRRRAADEPRPLVETRLTDGLTVDADGGIWVAAWTAVPCTATRPTAASTARARRRAPSRAAVRAG